MEQKMNQESVRYCRGVLDEIEEAVGFFGLVVCRLDPEETQGIPTGIITFPDGRSKKWSVNCNVLVTHVNEVSTGFVHLYRQLTPPAPEKRGELEAFAAGCNRMMALGCLSVIDDALSMKYVLVVEPGVELAKEQFQATLFTFIRQMENIARQAEGLCGGSMTVEQALDFNAVR